MILRTGQIDVGAARVALVLRNAEVARGPDADLVADACDSARLPTFRSLDGAARAIAAVQSLSSRRRVSALARFVEKVAVITGAGGGVGRATALRLASEGADVVAIDIVADRAEETAALAADYGVSTARPHRRTSQRRPRSPMPSLK